MKIILNNKIEEFCIHDLSYTKTRLLMTETRSCRSVNGCGDTKVRILKWEHKFSMEHF